MIAAPASNGAWMTIGMCCSLLASIVVTIVGMFALPEFVNAYASSGTDLPLVTRLLARGYALIWLAPLSVLVIWRFWPDAKRRHKVAGMVGLGTLMLIVPILLFALYLPIFGLAGTV